MSKRLFVGGLPYEMTDEKLQELFSQCGRVEKVKVMFDRATGRSKGFGFIEMATDLEGNAAILKFDGSMLGTRSISVKEAKPAEDRPRTGGVGGRPQNDNRPRENRGAGGFGDQRSPRNGGFSKPAGSGGFGGTNNRGGGYSKPSGSGGPGGSGGRGGYGRPSGSGSGSREKDSSDWRSELGLGSNQRKDFRRSSREHNNKDQNRRNNSDDFGNR